MDDAADPIQIAVAVLVRHGHVLLAHRRPDRHAYPNCWDLVGGHVERGESPREAVLRECLEELGVTVHEPTPVPFAHSNSVLDLHAFVVTSWEGEPRNAAPEEHDDLRWFRPTDLGTLTMADPVSVPHIVNAVLSVPS
ncbi:MAG: NUDIX domain-containing protein [Actinomycetales bacterium]|nr:NUDIX domain-containing protein [Actinomycetales bacterium]